MQQLPVPRSCLWVPSRSPETTDLSRGPRPPDSSFQGPRPVGRILVPKVTAPPSRASASSLPGSLPPPSTCLGPPAAWLCFISTPLTRLRLPPRWLFQLPQAEWERMAGLSPAPRGSSGCPRIMQLGEEDTQLPSCSEHSMASGRRFQETHVC